MIKLQIHWSSMLSRVFLVLLILLGSANAKEKEAQDIEVLAQSVTKEGNLVHAVGNVVLYSPKYLITADEAYYDYETSDVELIGNITILEGISYVSRSGHTNLNLKTDKGDSTPLFFFDESSNVWLKCENAIIDPQTYITQKSIVSSCNAQDPDWKIAFSSGEFDKENKWLHLYNPIFYANDIPLFYLPYFSFSTDKTRRTGLLKPEIGFGSSEGLYYRQPIYYAPEKDWDLEVDPQIRTNRGEGVHSTFRFADSAYSKGEFSTGYFKEHSDYAQEKSLRNDNHYGFKLIYDRSSLLSSQYSNLEDGLWVDLHYLNDIDYYNTLGHNIIAYDKLATSSVNYYIKRDLDYFGMYAKYYIDTSKISNADTLQELPTAHYHRFSNSFLLDNLLYSVDYKAKNYERSEGVTALQNEFNAPLTLYFSMFEDYLHVSASENVYMTHVSYGSEDANGGYGQYFRNYHKFSMYADLAKPYDNFLHTMYIGLDHVIPSVESKDGYMQDFIPIDTIEKSTALNLKEFFYTTDGEKKLSHKLRQVHYYSNDRYKYGDLENDLKYYVNENFFLGNAINYSHQYETFSRNQVSVNYKDDIYGTSLRYTYEDSTYENSLDKKDYSYVTLYADTKYFGGYNVFASADYDLGDEIVKSWSFGYKQTKKCWDYSLMYRDIKLPRLTSSSIDSVNRKGFLLQFNFYPIGSVSQDFSTQKEQKL